MGGTRYDTSVWTPPQPCVGRVLVLPGGGYTVDQNLLSWACQVADSSGWQVCTMRWHYDPHIDKLAFVESAADLLDSSCPRHDRTVVIAKSLGTLAARWANARGYPGIWLTPLLNDATVSQAIATASAPALAVGGTGDRLWNTEIASSLDCDVVEVVGADHGMVVGGDWRASLAALETTLVAIERFLTSLGAAPTG